MEENAPQNPKIESNRNNIPREVSETPPPELEDYHKKQHCPRQKPKF